MVGRVCNRQSGPVWGVDGARLCMAPGIYGGTSDATRELLSAQVEVVRGAIGHSSYGQEEYIEAWGVVVADIVFDDKGGCERVVGRACDR